jgi:hypothetical protein
MPQGRKSDAKREAVALRLAAGQTAKAAAAAAEVGLRTVRRWLEEPEFVARVEELRGEMLERAMARLTRTTTRAAGVLRALLESADEKVRLRAAQQVLEQATRLREAVTLEQRLRALEEAEATRKAEGGQWR